MVALTSEQRFNQEQIQHLSSLRFINKIDDHLGIISGIKIYSEDSDLSNYVLLILEIYYDGEKIDMLSFNLRNYDYEEIVKVARNIRSNEFILQEVDNLLAGNIE